MTRSGIIVVVVVVDPKITRATKGDARTVWMSDPYADLGEDEEEDDESDEDVFQPSSVRGTAQSSAPGEPSPRKKRKAKARGKEKADAHRPYAKDRAPRQDMQWKPIAGGQGLNTTELPIFLAKDDLAKAAGLGYQNAGRQCEPARHPESGAKCQRSLQRCGFHAEEDADGKRCEAKRAIYTLEDGTFDVFESTAGRVCHLSHVGNTRVKGLVGEVRGLISPGKANTSMPKKMRMDLRKKGVEFDANGRLEKMVAGYCATRRKQKRSSDMPDGQRGRYGGLSTYLAKLNRRACMDRHA